MGTPIDLSGQLAIVTGGGGGIGGAASEALAAAGAHVLVADIDEGLATERVERIQAAGGAATVVVADVRVPDQIAEIERVAAATADHVDILVNNVGHYVRPSSFLRSDESQWSDLADINFVHVLRCCRTFVPAMVERGSGSVVNVSSVEGMRGYPLDPVYAAYKAAVNHFTKCLALEVAPSGVRVNAIAPDVTQSIQVDYEAMVPADQRDRWPYWVPVGRVGEPSDNADVILFLASDLARFVTGHIVPTDGGTVLAGGWFRTEGRRGWTNRPRDP